MYKIQGVELQYTKKIIKTFEKYPDVLEVLVFGSRARGDYKKYSDIDLCISKKTRNAKTIGIGLELNDLNIPYKIDLVEIENVSESFKSVIEREGVVVYINK